MTIHTTFLPRAAASWSTDELNQLRVMAKSGASISTIAKSLKRSVSAVRNKGAMHGISLSAAGAKVRVCEVRCADDGVTSRLVG